jgi:hypothetical protein
VSRKIPRTPVERIASKEIFRGSGDGGHMPLKRCRAPRPIPLRIEGPLAAAYHP